LALWSAGSAARCAFGVMAIRDAEIANHASESILICCNHKNVDCVLTNGYYLKLKILKCSIQARRRR